MTKKGVLRNRDKCTVCGKCASACPNNVIEKIGHEYELEEIALLASRDRNFYETSGGGVTVTGGEPTIQAPFLFTLLKRLKTSGIHTAVETCGHFKRDSLVKLEELSDLTLFDIKHSDSNKHRQFTGVGNELILDNFKYLIERAGMSRIIPRIPLIPGFNTDAESQHCIMSFLEEAGYTGPVHLMPYNNMAKSKYKKIGRGQEYCDFGDLTDAMKSEISMIAKAHGYAPVLNE
jgi:pyruvate formate lyase activating enzyme